MRKRRWILWVLVASFAWLVFTRFNEVENIAQTLSQGIWLWVLVAALLQVVFYVLQARIYQVAFDLVGVRSNLLELVPVHLGSMFINAVAPSGGTAGLALYVDDAVKRGESGPRAAAGTLLGVIGTYAGFGLLLLYGLFYLQLQASIRIYESVAAVALLLFTLILSGLLLLGATRPRLLHKILSRFQQTVNRAVTRLRRSPLLSETWAGDTAAEFTAAADAARSSPRGLGAIFVWSVAAHLVSALCLYVLFVAFRQPASLAVAVAGFAIGHLFVIIAPSPQGVGFVEAIMPVTLTALGASSAVATIVVFAYRGLAFWLPMLAGFFLLQRLRSLGAEERSVTELWNVRIVALFAALMGFVNIVSAVYPQLTQDLGEMARYAPLQLRRGGQLGALLTGLALLVLAGALWRRKRAAWLITMVVLLLSATSHALNRSLLDYRTILTLLLAAWLLFMRPHFHARSDPPSVRQGLTITVAGLTFLFLYGMTGITILARRSGQALDLAEAAAQTVQVVFTLRPPPALLSTEAGQFLVFSLYAVGVVLLLTVFFLLLRPVLVRNPATPEEREQARLLVARHGRTSLARSALRPGTSYFFTAGGSAVAFQLVGRVALAAGTPVGPAEDTVEAIVAFAQHCKKNDWLPVFFQVPARTRDCYTEAGFDGIVIGPESTITFESFHLSRPAYETVRQGVGLLLRQGYSAEQVAPPHGTDLLSKLKLIDDAWKTMAGAGDSGAVLGWFDEDLVCQSPLVLAVAPTGFISAFATLHLDPKEEWVSVDLMRHRPQMGEGALELLLVTILRWARRQEYERVHLGVGVPEAVDNPGANQALHHLYRGLADSRAAADIFRVKAQFDPSWNPLYLMYPGTTSLPAAWTAIIRANSDGSWPMHLLRR
jgi:phosphatidylglycerol lysyltransferase